MEWTVLITNIASLLGIFGGWEAVKYLLHRKQNLRISEAKADSIEFSVLKEANEFLQNQLLEKEQRFAEQTKLVRKLSQDNLDTTKQKNEEILELTKEKSRLELELQRYRCVVKKCATREPQNGY